MELIKDIITTEKTLFDKSAHTELRAQVNRTRNASLLAGNLVRNARTEVSGVSARVYKNGVYGFSSVAQYNEESVKTVLKAATDNAIFMDSHVNKAKPLFVPLANESIKTPAPFDDAEQREYIDFMRCVDDYITNKYKNLASRSVSFRADSMEKLLSVNDGADLYSLVPRCFVYVLLSANTDDGTPVEVFTPVGGFGNFRDIFKDTKEIFAKTDMLYERLMQKREGVHADAGEKTCVLGGELAGMLAHEAVGHTVEADLVLGGSVAGHMLNKRVGSDLVNLVDFANTAFGERTPQPIFVDDEGTKAEDAVLIENGILKGYMNNRESAQHFGMKPQGNARAYLFSDEPLIRMRNTAVLPGKDKLEDMIASIDDGYYLIDSNNGQADITGEFMFGVSMGYEIKHGKLGRAILDTTISGVAFDMLKTVDMVGEKVIWMGAGTCGKKQPMPVGMGGPDLRCKVMIGGR